MKYVCENCQAEWTLDDLNPVKDIEQRVAPGEIMPAGECPDCGAVCHGVKTKFNHAYHMAFEVKSEAEDPDNVTTQEILVGLTDRLTNLLNNQSEVKEACEQYDVYEYDPKCKFCERHISRENLPKAHVHQEEWVCDNCWDDRLAATA